jgi:hypothetical protein
VVFSRSSAKTTETELVITYNDVESRTQITDVGEGGAAAKPKKKSKGKEEEKVKEEAPKEEAKPKKKRHHTH